jgi:ATP-dependent DNA ligase
MRSSRELVGANDPQIGRVLLCLQDRRPPLTRKILEAVGSEQRLLELAALEVAHVAERRVGDHHPDAAAERGARHWWSLDRAEVPLREAALAYPGHMPSREDLPRFVAPMLARTGSLPLDGGWAVEVKFDGMRLQLRRDGRAVCLRSRPGRNCTEEFPELATITRVLGRHRVLLDGELVCLGANGNPDFASLRRRLRAPAEKARRHAERAPATFLAFDLLHLDGRSTRELPYESRRELLLDLGLDGPRWRTPRHFVDEIDRVLAATEEHGLEGVVAKRLGSPYVPGGRNGAWVKHKHRRTETSS